MSGYRGRGVHGTTVELLGARIVDGTFGPGEVLDLRRLGDEMDISLSALREAIKVLAAKGLLDARQRRGTFVLPTAQWNGLDSDVMRWRSEAGGSATLLRDLAEIRGAIEPAAASLAAGRRDENDLQALEEAMARMVASRGSTPRAAAEADVVFHQALLDATHNELFRQMGVLVEPALFTRAELVHDRATPDPVPSHRRVVDAVTAGDADAARAATQSLLDQSLEDARRLHLRDVASEGTVG